MDIKSLAQQYYERYAPGGTGHGYYTLIGDGRRDDCNVEGKLDKAKKGFAHEPVTVELWVLHLEGKQGLGIVPIRLDGTVRWGAIDIDVYAGLDHREIAQKALMLGYPVIVCKTKSGGAHLYLFTKEDVTAAGMQNKLREIAAALGFANAEIFPKQTSLVDSGSWINMPYFGGEDSTRYAITPDGEALSLEQFLDRASQLAVGADFFKGSSGNTGSAEKKQPEAFPDGPPCLNHLAKLGFPNGTRDASLFNIGTYMRKKIPGDGWKKAVEQANQQFFEDPLDSASVLKIIKSLDKTKYFYTCNSHPLAPHCDSRKCRTRKHGVGEGGNVFPELGEVRKMLTDPPVYFFDISMGDKSVTLELSADEVQEYRLFKRAVFRATDANLMSMKADEWSKALNTHFEGNLVKIDAAPDSSQDGQVWVEINRFCTSNPADVLDEVLQGRPAKVAGRTYFQLRALLKHVISSGFREMKAHTLAALLRGKGKKGQERATDEQKWIKGINVHVWSIETPETPQGDFDVPDAIKLQEKPF